MTWYLAVLKTTRVSAGGPARRQYWTFVLVNAIIGIALVVTGKLTKMPEIATFGIGMSRNVPGVFGIGVFSNPFLFQVYALATFLPFLAAEVRRLHDIGRTGWWWLFGLVPCWAGSCWWPSARLMVSPVTTGTARTRRPAIRAQRRTARVSSSGRGPGHSRTGYHPTTPASRYFRGLRTNLDDPRSCHGTEGDARRVPGGRPMLITAPKARYGASYVLTGIEATSGPNGGSGTPVPWRVVTFCHVMSGSGRVCASASSAAVQLSQ